MRAQHPPSVLSLEVPDSFPPWLSGTSTCVPCRLPGKVPMDPDRATCSAKGCAADAVWELRWNNPKIHTPDRRKTWLACDEHRESLSDFLGARGVLRDVVAHEG